MTIEIINETIPLKHDAMGRIRVGGTRVTLEAVITLFEQGASAEEIVQRFSSLDLADVYFAIGYYLRHHPEVKAYLSERRHRAQKIQHEHTSRQEMLRERLLARRKLQNMANQEL